METTTQTKWKVDPTHSEVEFKAKHLMITTVKGHFTEYDLEVETEGDDFEKASNIVFTANVNSLTTNNEDRDNHLKSDDFFDAENHQDLKFVGKDINKIRDDKYELTGDLTIRGTTKTITVDVEHGGTVVDPYGNNKAGFIVDGKINRKEFGLKWNAVTEAGNVVVSDEIKFHCEIQLVKQE